jgi:hypothetical protein
MTPPFLALVLVGSTGAAYDARAHRLQARAAAAADLRAPSAEVARWKAERTARARAEHKLEAALRALGADGDPGKIVANATIADERYGSDGSVELTLALSTDGIVK